MTAPCLLAIIGGGNMGAALLAGSMGYAPLKDARRVVAEPDTGKHATLARDGVQLVTSAAAALDQLDPAGAIVLAVKPQMFPDVALELAHRVGDRLVISIMAGLTTQRLAAELGPRARIVRAMPNLPVSIGLGASAYCPGPHATDADLQFARGLFATVGHVFALDEPMLDAFTAVAGSGPAYLFYLAEAMITGAQGVGFSASEAREIVHRTLIGAAALLDREPADPALLRSRVTSKGGTTAAAIAELDRAAVLDTWSRAIAAARDRGRELSAS